MEPTVSIPSAATVAAVTGWYDKIKEYFTDFRPETRAMSINFSRKTSQIRFQITVPEGWRKNARMVKIPALSRYQLLRMSDEGFQEQKYLWKDEGGYFVLKAKDLPSSEKYLVEMEGVVDDKVLEQFVYIKPSSNRNNDDKNDKYWLESSIKQPSSLEKIYSDLEIDEVNFGVAVNIDKMFGLTIPQELKNKTKSIQELLTASKNFDRNKILKAALEFKKHERISPSYNPGAFFKIVQKVTARDLIRKHVHIDRPYDLGSIDQPVKYNGIIPQNINIQAITRLTLRDPIASGYLMFERESYMKKLRAEFKKLAVDDGASGEETE